MYLKLVLEKLKPNAFEGRLNDKVGGGGGGVAAMQNPVSINQIGYNYNRVT